MKSFIILVIVPNYIYCQFTEVSISNVWRVNYWKSFIINYPFVFSEYFPDLVKR